MSPDGVQQSAVVHLNQRTGWSLVLLEIASRGALRRPEQSPEVAMCGPVNGNAQIRNGVGQQASNQRAGWWRCCAQGVRQKAGGGDTDMQMSCSPIPEVNRS